MRQAVAFFFMVLLSVGALVLTYNFVSMIVHYKKTGLKKWASVKNQNHIVLDPLVEMPEYVKRPRNQRRPFHVAVTATNKTYSKWQCRIMYYWYRKKKDLPGSNMGKFTRILHSGSPDNLMDEIPTFVVDPLPPGLDQVRSSHSSSRSITFLRKTFIVVFLQSFFIVVFRVGVNLLSLTFCPF